MERSGLKVSWPQEAAVNRLTAAGTDAPASVGPGLTSAGGPASIVAEPARADGSALIAAGSAGVDGRAFAASGSASADRPASPGEASRELSEALAELSELEACGLRVLRPTCKDRLRFR